MIDCREKIEHDLIFLGLVVMENRLKPQTEGKHTSFSIDPWQKSPFRCFENPFQCEYSNNHVYWSVSPFVFSENKSLIYLFMIIGDNILTALSVARDCDMIPDDAKIIAVEVTEPNSTPTFTYAQVFNRRVKEVQYDLNVRI